jgi:hypothetical protein
MNMGQHCALKSAKINQNRRKSKYYGTTKISRRRNGEFPPFLLREQAKILQNDRNHVKDGLKKCNCSDRPRWFQGRGLIGAKVFAPLFSKSDCFPVLTQDHQTPMLAIVQRSPFR